MSVDPKKNIVSDETAENVRTAAERSAKNKPAAKRNGRSAAGSKSAKLRPQEEKDIFALDIGTRSVVGIIGHMSDGIFCIDYTAAVPHKQRAMIDGQIEDISEVARVAGMVKEKLEEKSGIKLTRAAIAAAGRALRTRRTQMSFNIEDKETITADDIKTFELECSIKAQEELDAEKGDQAFSFYCVGHTVIRYLLDDYQISSLAGHKGKRAAVELIAAFLPETVVESLYAVTDMTGLDVSSLTLEPIAAMNVIIPPNIRLINIALVDIGAGTSDIAVSQNGSIVAYAMSTVAGDEITEEIVRNYIVDFQTAERMKLSGGKETITYKDILGFEHSIEEKEFFDSLTPAVETLADDISEHIITANGQAPAAVFLVGGGSLVPGLAQAVAEKLGIPQSRVAIGGREAMKNISFGRSRITGPEYVTPVGIGVTAAKNGGYDFSVITLNGKKIRIFDTRTVRILDLLMSEGYKTSHIIGHTGRSLTFTLNGEKQFFKGEPSTAAEVTVNGESASLETTVRQGDVIEFRPAGNGRNAEVKISDIAGDVTVRKVFIDGTEYPFGVIAAVNDRRITSDYVIQNFDSVTVSEIETLGELMETLPFDTSRLDFYRSGKLLSIDHILRDNDDIITADKLAAERSDEVSPKLISGLPDSGSSENTGIDGIAPEGFRVTLNGKSIILEPRPNDLPHEFIELMALADIDLDSPPESGDMILTVNGKEANFMDVLHEGDNAVIRWAEA